MSDKFPTISSFDITFTEGEIPSPAKLNALSAQLRRIAGQLEKAIGDIHGQSWPYTGASTTTLIENWGEKVTNGNTLDGAGPRDPDIVNISRLIGPASNLNPKMIGGNQTIEEATPVGVHEFSLKYPVTTGTTTSTDASLTNKVSSASDILIDGDWAVGTNGKVRCFTATAGGTITYQTNSNKFGGGLNYSSATFNVIPDPNQIANGVGVTLSALDGSGRRTITLPTITHQQSNITLDDIALSDEDINFGQTLQLPNVLVDSYTSGDEIPSGFLYLKNETTNEVYTDAFYYYLSSSSLQIANADLADAINAGHVFSIITVGTTITASIDDLRNKTYHTHNRDLGEPFVDIDGIVGQYQDAGISGVYVPSEIPGNKFAQYLHRDGYRSTYDASANDHNAMRGSVCLGLVDGTPGNYLGNVGESYKVMFGGGAGTNPYIKKNTDEELYFYHEGDFHFETSSAIANIAKFDPIVKVNAGLVGDVVGIGPGFLSNGLAPYGMSGSFSTAITAFVNTITLPSDIRAKTWFSLDFAIGIPTANVAGDPGFTWDKDWAGYEYNLTIDEDNVIVLWPTGGFWENEPTLDYKLVIWYQP